MKASFRDRISVRLDFTPTNLFELKVFDFSGFLHQSFDRPGDPAGSRKDQKQADHGDQRSDQQGLKNNLSSRPDDFRLGYNSRNYPFFSKRCGKSKEETQIGAAAGGRGKNFRTGGQVFTVGILKPRNLEILYLRQAAAALAGGLIGRLAPGGDDLTGIVYDKNFPVLYEPLGSDEFSQAVQGNVDTDNRLEAPF